MDRDQVNVTSQDAQPTGDRGRDGTVCRPGGGGVFGDVTPAGIEDRPHLPAGLFLDVIAVLTGPATVECAGRAVVRVRPGVVDVPDRGIAVRGAAGLIP